MRARGLALLAGGALACLSLPAATTAQQSGPSQGERAFQKCYACHALGENDEGAEGPSLRGIVGRKVAGLAGYGYSGPLRAYALAQPRWSRAALDAFLADPQAAVPGNAMGFFGIKDPAERAALIEYLAARLRRERGGRGDRIRTCDILLPKQARYRTAPLPDTLSSRPPCPGGPGRIRTRDLAVMSGQL